MAALVCILPERFLESTLFRVHPGVEVAGDDTGQGLESSPLLSLLTLMRNVDVSPRQTALHTNNELHSMLSFDS